MKVTVNNLEKEETIDWSKVQLVISDDENKRIVQVSKSQELAESKRLFCGQEISTGIFYKSWIKILFKPFHGSITIQND